jgi:hypothetical protein
MLFSSAMTSRHAAAPACHTLHYGWDYCSRDEESGTAQCQRDIDIGTAWHTVYNALRTCIDARKEAA